RQDAAEQAVPVGADDELLVDAVGRVGERHHAAARPGGVRIAKAGDVHAHELELGAHVEGAELRVAAGDRRNGRARHLVAGSHQTVGAAAVLGALAHGDDVTNGCTAPVVDGYSPP